MSVLVVGSIALDTVKTPAGQVTEALGGSAVYFSFATRLFAPVRIVGVVGRDFPESHWSLLRGRGIDLTDLRVAPGKTFRWSGAYEGDMAVARTLDTQLNVFQEFEPQLSPESAASPWVFLANIHPSLQLRVLSQVPRARHVFCDTMNLWIRTQKNELQALFSEVAGVVLNDQEARQLTGEDNLVRAGRQVLALGPRVLIIKKGEHGVLLFQGSEVAALPAFPLEQVVDPTGAGDTFAGGFMGCLAQGGEDISLASLKRAAAHGIVAASFCCEGFSLDRLKDLRHEQFQARLGLYQDMVSWKT
ncbi:MAG: sugar kinase [Planctomycetes bacterium]|nr:sugar kinase [Planctomycetota bacterium]